MLATWNKVQYAVLGAACNAIQYYQSPEHYLIRSLRHTRVYDVVNGISKFVADFLCCGSGCGIMAVKQRKRQRGPVHACCEDKVELEKSMLD